MLTRLRLTLWQLANPTTTRQQILTGLAVAFVVIGFGGAANLAMAR